MKSLPNKTEQRGPRRAGALPGALAVVAAPAAHAAGGSSVDEMVFFGLLVLIPGGLAVWDVLRRRKRRGERKEGEDR